jgi:tetratricopeptide (TPR) repeat protein
MTRLWLGCLTSLVLGTSGAIAAGYDDFAQGVSALNRGDNDQAVAFFTSALSAGDLNANLVPTAYLDRARAHVAKEEYAPAIPDLTAVIKARPDSAPAYVMRGFASTFVGDTTGAIADYTEAIALSPDGNAYAGRARAYWIAGNFADAAKDFAQSVKLFPRGTYWVLWHGMADARAGSFDSAVFSDEMSALDFDGWPRPLFDLYRARITPEILLRAAGEGDTKAVSGQRCEANFYIAQWWLARKNADAAKPLLEDARANCPRDYDLRFMADVELKRL